MYAGVWLAPLGGADLSLFLAGKTGTFKSETAALAQQHFGLALDRTHLPANWSSTANALEGLAHTTKDALLVVDDFCPVGGKGDVDRLHRDADRLMRGAGNHAGRQRMRADASLKDPKPPPCLVLATGEDIPRGPSLQSRMVVVEIKAGDVDPGVLSVCQRDAAAGAYAKAMSGYLVWLASRRDSLPAQLRAEIQDFRDLTYQNQQHRRTPTNAGQLYAALRWFLLFAQEAGAIAADQADALCARFRVVLEQSAADQADALCARFRVVLEQSAANQAVDQRDQDQARRFLRLLAAAVASGRAHVAARDGGPPRGNEDPAAWGWCQRSLLNVESALPELGWEARGSCVGWWDGGLLYLEPEASHALAQKMADEQGEHLSTTPSSLRKRLADHGLLVQTDTSRQTLTLRRMIQGKTREVLVLNASSLFNLDGLTDVEPADLDFDSL